MGVVNASDHAVKVFRGKDRYQGMEGWSFAGEPFGNAIELGVRGEMFRWRGLHSEV
jgi:hypothetical protein